jgi:hypothetical protein
LYLPLLIHEIFPEVTDTVSPPFEGYQITYMGSDKSAVLEEKITFFGSFFFGSICRSAKSSSVSYAISVAYQKHSGGWLEFFVLHISNPSEGFFSPLRITWAFVIIRVGETTNALHLEVISNSSEIML